MTTPNLSRLSQDNTVILITDHQVGLYTGVRDISVSDLKHNVVALAKSAKILGVPVILTSTMSDGMWGKIIPELTEALPDVTPIDRTMVNAFDDERVVKAVKDTGRMQLVVAGISLETCATYPALSAKEMGYDARVVLDASGTFNPYKHEAGIERLSQAGVIVMDYATVVVEMLRDNAHPKAHEVYGAMDMPFAGLVGQLTSGN